MRHAIPDYPFTSRFVEVYGSRIDYIEEGQGDPILFVHGMPSWSYLWRNVIPHVSKAGRCIALDLIGFRKSDSPDMEFRAMDELKYLTAFVEKLGLRNLAIVGHSWGSVLGCEYARRHEHNVRALAYLEPILGSWKSWSEFNPNAPAMQALFKRLRSSESWDLIVGQNFFLEQVFVNGSLRRLSQEEKDAYIGPFRDPARRKAAWRAPQELPIEGSPADVCALVDELLVWLKKTGTPQLFFRTEPAAFFTAERAAGFLADTQNVTEHFLGGGVYNHLEDYPSEVATALLQWLASLQSTNVTAPEAIQS